MNYISLKTVHLCVLTDYTFIAYIKLLYQHKNDVLRDQHNVKKKKERKRNTLQ